MVDDKVEENINDLLDIEEYIILNRKLQKLTVELISNLDIEQTHKFREYQQIKLELSSFSARMFFKNALYSSPLIFIFIVTQNYFLASK